MGVGQDKEGVEGTFFGQGTRAEQPQLLVCRGSRMVSRASFSPVVSGQTLPNTLWESKLLSLSLRLLPGAELSVHVPHIFIISQADKENLGEKSHSCLETQQVSADPGLRECKSPTSAADLKKKIPSYCESERGSCCHALKE